MISLIYCILAQILVQKKYEKKRPIGAASRGFSYAPDPTLDRKFSNTTVSWSLRRPAR